MSYLENCFIVEKFKVFLFLFINFNQKEKKTVKYKTYNHSFILGKKRRNKKNEPATMMIISVYIYVCVLCRKIINKKTKQSEVKTICLAECVSKQNEKKVKNIKSKCVKFTRQMKIFFVLFASFLFLAKKKK